MVGEAVEGGLDAPRGFVGDGLEFGPLGTWTMAWGSRAWTRVVPAWRRTTTLQGSSSPISGSICSAWWASWGLQAPRIRYGSVSWPSLCLRVAWTSDLGQGAEPLSPEGVLDLGDGVLEGQIQGAGVTVGHGGLAGQVWL